MTTIDKTVLTNKDVTSGNCNSIIKKIHRISDIPFVVIDNTLLKALMLKEEEHTWVEEKLIDEGILLKIHKFSS